MSCWLVLLLKMFVYFSSILEETVGSLIIHAVFLGCSSHNIELVFILQRMWKIVLSQLYMTGAQWLFEWLTPMITHRTSSTESSSRPFQRTWETATPPSSRWWLRTTTRGTTPESPIPLLVRSVISNAMYYCMTELKLQVLEFSVCCDAI